MADEQNRSEFEAQLEDQAEDLRPLATEEHKALIAYAHAQMEHFQQIDGCYVQGIITYKGEFLLATLHQTSIEDIANDSWTLAIEPIEFVGVINASQEALAGDQVLSVENISSEDGSDEDSSTFPF